MRVVPRRLLPSSLALLPTSRGTLAALPRLYATGRPMARPAQAMAHDDDAR